MVPIVLVMSFGAVKPVQIINNIIKSNGGSKKMEKTSIGLSALEAHLCDIKTKYYENTIALLPSTEDPEIIPDDILKNVEGLIIFFNSDDKSLLKAIPRLCNLKTNNNIDVGILATDRLSDDSASGPTYKELKDMCKTNFDIIELNSDCCQNDEYNSKQDEYDDILQTLKNHVWSNVECKDLNSKDENIHLENVEEQLEAFEHLLTNVQHFKSISSTLGRQEILDQAEKLADLFASILDED